MGISAKLVLGGFGLAGAGLGLANWLGSVGWSNRTSQLVDRLERTRSGEAQEAVTFQELLDLPVPVVRYFRRALREGQPVIRSARIDWAGEFRTGGAGDDGWRPFEAVEYFSARRPGFLWDASIRMAPLVNVRVRDAYVSGEASMQAKVLSLMSMVDERGKAELNAGALQRYLAEAVWLPTALLPGADVKWSAIDDGRALATLSDSGTTVSLEFRFNAEGEIISAFTPGRYREVNGRYESTPWEGCFHSYEERSGMWIPTEGSVEWKLQDGSFAYWRGRVIGVRYDFAPQRD